MGTYLELNYLKDLQGEFSSIEFVVYLNQCLVVNNINKCES